MFIATQIGSSLSDPRGLFNGILYWISNNIIFKRLLNYQNVHESRFHILFDGWVSPSIVPVLSLDSHAWFGTARVL
jgi:hypothetical protein